MSEYDEIPEDISKQILDLQLKINVAKSLTITKQREDALTKAEKQYKRVRRLLETYQIAIESGQYAKGIETHKSQYKEFDGKLSKMDKLLVSARNQPGGAEEDLFKHRGKSSKNVDYNNRAELIQEANRLQDDGLDKLHQINKDVYQMDERANIIGVELDRQINALDGIYDHMSDTETTLNRAEEKLKYFARSIYTDRLMICLIIVIAIAIIVIIALAIAGKTPKAANGTIKP